MKKWAVFACVGALLLGVVTFLYVHGYFDSQAVKEASTTTDESISSGRWELDEAYRRVEEKTQETVSRVTTVRREVRENVEAMDSDSLIDTWNYELALYRNGDRESTGGVDGKDRGVLPDAAGSQGYGKRVTVAPVRSGDLAGGI